MKIGELAERTGLTIRTLRWYDQIGLLPPSGRTEAGHRVYNEEDLARLQKVLSLRALDFTLEEITDCLASPDFDHYTLVRMHRVRAERELQRTGDLRDRLSRLEGYLERREEVSTESFINAIEGSIMIEKYYSNEEQEKLAERTEKVGGERMREVEKEWADLFAEVREQMEKKADPTSEPVLVLARRWKALIAEFTGGDPEIASSLQKMYKEEGPEKASQGMLDRGVMEFMGEALRLV